MNAQMAADGIVQLDDGGKAISLSATPRWFDFELPNSRYLKAELSVSSEEANPKGVVCRIEFYDEEGVQLPTGAWITNSPLVGDFVYLATADSAQASKYLLAPVGATRLRLGFQTWQVRAAELSASIEFNVVSVNEIQSALGITVDGIRSPRDIRVAFIADEFTYNSFSYECDAIALEPNRWRAQMDEHAPDILFCESAWSGADSSVRPWKGQVYASVNFPKENRNTLLDIIKYCKSRKIPTVFWNKEDPTHFGDRVHDFVKTATEFDYVYTTAIECLDRYRNEYGIDNIDVLPFATQPRLFNPVRQAKRTHGASFAGGWYANHEERCKATVSIFDAVLESGMPLSIFDRFFESEDALHHYPELYQTYVHRPVAHSDVSDAYKNSTVGININTVTDSRTMFARRVFELASCDTLIISNPAVGLADFFDGGVIIVDPEDSMTNPLEKITSSEAARLRHTALTAVLTRHTYRHRFQKILDSIGMDYVPSRRSVVLAGKVRTAEDAEVVIAAGYRLGDRISSIVLIVDREIRSTQVSRMYERFNRFGVQVISIAAWERYGVFDGFTDESDDFLLCDPQSVTSITGEKLTQLLMHREYSNDILTLAATEDQRYIFTNEIKANAALIPSSKIDLPILSETDIRGLIYCV